MHLQQTRDCVIHTTLRVLEHKKGRKTINKTPNEKGTHASKCYLVNEITINYSIFWFEYHKNRSETK